MPTLLCAYSSGVLMQADLILDETTLLDQTKFLDVFLPTLPPLVPTEGNLLHLILPAVT